MLRYIRKTPMESTTLVQGVRKNIKVEAEVMKNIKGYTALSEDTIWQYVSTASTEE